MKATAHLDLDRLLVLTELSNFRREGSGWKCRVIEPIFKFVVTSADELVIAPIRDHMELYAVHMAWGLSATTAAGHARHLVKNHYGERGLIIGAGEISSTGQVTGWVSGGFRLVTPQHLRPDIERLVDELYKSGGLSIPGISDK